MKCPQCDLQGHKRFKGYCSRVHYKLHKRKPQKLIIPCSGCGDYQKRNPSQVSPSGKVFCSKCKKNKAENHPRWKEGQYISDDGYRIVLVNGSYQREHRVIWQKANQATLLSNGTIHHIDFDKLNNDPDNLLLFSSEEHGRFHRYFEAARYPEAAAILRMAAIRQAHHPTGVDRFIQNLPDA